MRRKVCERSMTAVAAAWLLAAVSMAQQPAQAIDIERNAAAKALVEELSEQPALDAEWIRVLIADAVYQESIVEAITRPAEKKFSWYRYRKIFVTEANVIAGVQFWNENAQALAKAERDYGVAAQVIVAIIGVETRFGRYTGRHRVIDSLVTLTLGYPRRSDFFKRELAEFLTLVNEEDLNPLEVRGSYAGAMGIPQFISSSYRHYAVDFNGNGRRDLIGEVDDAIGSVANYLAAHGWQPNGRTHATLSAADETVLEDLLTEGLSNDRSYADLKQAGAALARAGGPADDLQLGVLKFETRPGIFSYRAGYPNFYVITKYNRSTLYAMAVAEFAELIAAKRNAS